MANPPLDAKPEALISEEAAGYRHRRRCERRTHDAQPPVCRRVVGITRPELGSECSSAWRGVMNMAGE